MPADSVFVGDDTVTGKHSGNDSVFTGLVGHEFDELVPRDSRMVPFVDVGERATPGRHGIRVEGIVFVDKSQEVGPFE